jgi:hypothetical protein
MGIHRSTLQRYLLLKRNAGALAAAFPRRSVGTIAIEVMPELWNEQNPLLIGIDDTVVQVHIVLCA